MKRSLLKCVLVLGASLGGSVALAAPPAWPAHMPRVEVRASSTFGGDLADFAPWRVLDGWARGLWCEGRPGPGVGEELTLTFAEPQALGRVRVEGGVLVSPEHFSANDVPVVLELRTGDGRVVEGRDAALTPGEVPDDVRGVVDFQLGGEPVRELTLRVRGVVGPTTGPHHTCLSEVHLARPGQDAVRAPEEVAWLTPVFLVPAAYDALPNALAQLWRAFGSCEVKGLQEAVRLPFAFDYPEARRTLPQGSVTELTRVVYQDAAQLSRACRSSPSQVPATRGVRDVQALFGELRVESPTSVLLLVPGAGRGAEPAQWHLAWDGRRWQLTGVR